MRTVAIAITTLEVAKSALVHLAVTLASAFTKVPGRVPDIQWAAATTTVLFARTPILLENLAIKVEVIAVLTNDSEDELGGGCLTATETLAPLVSLLLSTLYHSY